MEVVGWHLGIPSSEVYGAATSYTELRTEEPGETLVRVCAALPCLVSGSAAILSTLESELGVKSGQTSDDARYTLEEVPCGFLCGMAPAVEIDGRWHGRLDPDSALRLVRDSARCLNPPASAVSLTPPKTGWRSLRTESLESPSRSDIAALPPEPPNSPKTSPPASATPRQS